MMQKILKKLNKDQRGLTLTELIVTFALMGILLGAVAMVLTSSMSLHTELTSVMYGASVSETLLDKMTGELAGAVALADSAIWLEEEEEEALPKLGFYNKDGVPCKFEIHEGRLYMEGTDWSMDSAAYMGYRITGIRFTRLNDKNVLEIGITLQNLKTGFTFQDSKSVKCYQFQKQEDYQKIKLEV